MAKDHCSNPGAQKKHPEDPGSLMPLRGHPEIPGTLTWPRGVPAQHSIPATASTESQPLAVLHRALGHRDPWAACCLWHPWDCSSQLLYQSLPLKMPSAPSVTLPSCAELGWSPAFSHPCGPSPRLSAELSAASVCVRGQPQAYFSPSPESSDSRDPFLGWGKQ